MNYELQTKHGLTLTEMTVVIVVVALLASFALPAARMLFNSFQSQSGTKAVISAALSSARAIAAKHQRYAGIRFQEDLQGHQYMVFIIYDAELPHGVQGNLGFRAVEGIEPIKLPDSVGAMDFVIVTDRSLSDYNEIRLDAQGLPNPDNWIDQNVEFTDTTTFSLIFSQSGKLVIHDLWLLNRDGIKNTTAGNSYDDIFNKDGPVEAGDAMFYQDDSLSSGSSLGRELSRNSFIIYDRVEFDKVNVNRRWSDYLYKLVPEKIYINAYTGTMIKR